MIDLHTHSTFSDGSLTPEQLVIEAEKAELSAIALTDHDSVEGTDRFIAACRKSPVRGIPGVEISVDFNTGTMHILGYCIDHHHPELEAHLADLSAGRKARNNHILKKLHGMGLILTMNEVNSFAGGDNVGRLHFAQALVVRGYVKSKQEAFDRFLGKGKPGYTDRVRLTPDGGISMIRNAKGLAVLAHPFTLGLGIAALSKLVGELVEAGLQGIEVYYSQHTPKQVKQFCSIARKFNLAATGGTDFHGAPMPDIKIGRGFGMLNVPDTVLEELDERRKS